MEMIIKKCSRFFFFFSFSLFSVIFLMRNRVIKFRTTNKGKKMKEIYIFRGNGGYFTKHVFWRF